MRGNSNGQIVKHQPDGGLVRAPRLVTVGQRLVVGDVPGPAMRQWRRWCLDPDYVVGMADQLVNVDISAEEWLCELPASFPAYVAKYLLDAWAAAAGQPAFVTSTVAELTGTPARTFFEWASRRAAEFQA